MNQCILKAGVFVLPTISESDFFKFLITGLSCFAIRSFCILKPLVLAKPTWSVLTLTVTGTPASSPNFSLLLIFLSSS